MNVHRKKASYWAKRDASKEIGVNARHDIDHSWPPLHLSFVKAKGCATRTMLDGMHKQGMRDEERAEDDGLTG